MAAKDTPKFRSRRFLAVRFWPTWILFALMYLLARLPLRVQMWLGARTGDLLYLLHKKRRLITRVNLKLSFPQRTDSELQGLVRRAFQSFGKGLFEMSSLWFRKPEFLLKNCTVEGLEYVKTAQSQGHGIILLQAHFSTLELGANLLATQLSMDANYDPPKNPLFAEFLLNRRLKYFDNMIDNHNIRHMVRRLRDGACVWYSPDQHVSESAGGLHTTFFGQEVLTVGGASRMAKISGALVIPYLSTRNQQAGHYHLKLFPPLDNFPGESVVADTQRTNDIFEQQIRDHPEQYFWLHKRFKRIDKNHTDHYA